MSGPAARAALLALALAPAGTPAAAPPAARAWYLPDQAKLQFAGDIGFLSPGVGYAWAERRLEGDLFFGWVPRAVGGEDIVSFTGKLTWLPWELPLGRRWLVRPFSAAVQLTYTLGHEYFLVLPERYGPNYYDFETALRAGLALGGTVGRRGGGALKEIGVYWELVALDAMLVIWYRNTGTFGPRDVFTLALGIRLAL
jgi:hypothetical protein